MRDDFSFLGGTTRVPRPRWWIYAPVVSPKPGKTLELFSLSEHPWGAKLHWVDGRHLVCRLTRDCPMCSAGQGRTWKGFLPAAGLDHKNLYIAAVTEEAAECLDEIRQRQGSIMHTSLLFERAGNSNKSPVRVSALLRRPDQQRLPKPFDVRPQVLNVHGYNHEAVIEIMAKWQTFCEVG